MKEIKFRAWEKNLKEMIPVNNINFKSKIINSEGLWRYFDEVELLQFTGLHDKNETPIYEGDIIEMADGDFSWREKVEHYRGCFMADENVLATINSDCLVIGNVFENPELLKEKPTDGNQ